jgi:hypothetical protein
MLAGAFEQRVLEGFDGLFEARRPGLTLTERL